MIRRQFSPTLASSPRFLLSWVAWTAAGLLLCGVFWYFQLGDIQETGLEHIPVHGASLQLAK